MSLCVQLSRTARFPTSLSRGTSSAWAVAHVAEPAGRPASSPATCRHHTGLKTRAVILWRHTVHVPHEPSTGKTLTGRTRRHTHTTQQTRNVTHMWTLSLQRQNADGHTTGRNGQDTLCRGKRWWRDENDEHENCADIHGACRTLVSVSCRPALLPVTSPVALHVTSPVTTVTCPITSPVTSLVLLSPPLHILRGPVAPLFALSGAELKSWDGPHLCNRDAECQTEMTRVTVWHRHSDTVHLCQSNSSSPCTLLSYFLPFSFVPRASG